MSETTQSWADWILSSYSESINPTPAEPLPTPDDSDLSASSSSANASPDTASSSSPWGPYSKTGRGGAGNFQWQSDLHPSHHNNDIEAQVQAQHHHHHHHPHPSIRPRQTSTDKLSSTKRRPSKILTGRGGAGNANTNVNAVPATYASGTPRSPTSSTWPLSPTSPLLPSSSSSTATPRSASTSAAVYGRGGAGNFNASSLALNQQLKVDEERRVAEDLMREKAEHDVEGMLRPPEGAFLVGARRRESAVWV